MKTIYFGGTILTMEEDFYAQAVLAEDGVIRAVGTAAELRALAPDAAPYDLQGKTMLPAFLDPHSHFTAAANAFLQLSLEDAASLEEIEYRIRKFIRNNNILPGSWVTAKGYDQNELPGGTHPPLSFLDRCAPEHPMVLQHQSGHMGVFNSLALRTLGVTPETEAPAGGMIEKRDGSLTGYMEETAFVSYLQKTPMPDVSALLCAYEKAQALYASHGIVTVQEGMMVDSLLPLYRQLLDRGLLRLDVVGFPGPESEESFSHAFPGNVKRYENHFKIGGIKIFLDGSPQGKTAWMRTPYAGDPDYCGYGTMRDEDVLAAIGYAYERRLQILAHCNGDAAAAQYLRCLDAAFSAGLDVRRLRPVMIHAQLLGRDQLEAVKRLGVIPSFFVGHVYHWGDTHLKNFGPERAAAISPAASARNAGILYTFHQDTPVTDPDMLETVWCAVNRMTKKGAVLGREESVSVLDALKAVTCNAAYQYFEEESKGSIRPGKNADFTILDANPLTVAPMEIRNIKVTAAIKSGTFLYGK